MDDFSWPPKKRPTLKIVPGPRSRPKISYDDASSEPPAASLKPMAAEMSAEEAAEKHVAEMFQDTTNRSHTDKKEAPTPRDKDQTLTSAANVAAKSQKPVSATKKKRIYFKKISLSKKQWVMVVGAVILITGGGSAGAWKLYNQSRYVAPLAAVPKLPEKKEPPAPTTEPSRLTGVEVDPSLNLRPVTAVIIENSPDARPQSGLKDAGLVFEAVAEGGITRFLALYQAEKPGSIGPIRSVRPYFVDFALPFEAGIAHVGGSPQALADIRSLSARDLDQFANGDAYIRISERAAPHNVYTNFEKLDALNARKGFTSSTFTSFARKKEARAEAATASVINLDISSALYDVKYEYDGTTNSYLRAQGGTPHVDADSGTRLAPKVVIALVMTKGIDADGTHTVYGTVGSGKMFVFQDGLVAEGTWSKSDRKAQFSFTNAAGEPLAINAGQTWLTLADSAAKVTYTP